MSPTAPDRIPVTVLTGFLGAGKTTLLNRILTEHHGQRIAVIENEFGEIGIDQALVISADEEIFEMSNGCICCTVRGDLIRVLGNLVKRRDRFDRVLVETTGMANPGPVAQTFFVDDDVQRDFRLDGIVTVVDARHADLHLGETGEALEQVAFADVLVVNKTDLSTLDAVADLTQRIRGINAVAKVLHTSHGAVPLADVLDVGGFDLDRALARTPTFLEPEYPFEWAGVFEVPAAGAELVVAAGPDPTMKVFAHRAGPGAEPEVALRGGAERVLRAFATPTGTLDDGQALPVDGQAWILRMPEAGHHRFPLTVEAAGPVVVYTQHRPEEFALEVRRQGVALVAGAAVEFVPAHGHEDAVSSVGVELDRPLDEAKLNKWLGQLLRERGTELYRMKGILDVAGQDRRYVFQAVHMLLDGRPDQPWPPGPRRSQVVFIRKNLDRALLREGLAACQV